MDRVTVWKMRLELFKVDLCKGDGRKNKKCQQVKLEDVPSVVDIV